MVEDKEKMPIEHQMGEKIVSKAYFGKEWAGYCRVITL
jgi:hypothetical protein